MMIIDDDSRVVNKLEASLTDDARVVIYNRHMFIVQATEQQQFSYILLNAKLLWNIISYFPIISSFLLNNTLNLFSLFNSY